MSVEAIAPLCPCQGDLALRTQLRPLSIWTVVRREAFWSWLRELTMSNGTFVCDRIMERSRSLALACQSPSMSRIRISDWGVSCYRF